MCTNSETGKPNDFRGFWCFITWFCFVCVFIYFKIILGKFAKSEIYLFHFSFITVDWRLRSLICNWHIYLHTFFLSWDYFICIRIDRSSYLFVCVCVCNFFYLTTQFIWYCVWSFSFSSKEIIFWSCVVHFHGHFVLIVLRFVLCYLIFDFCWLCWFSFSIVLLFFFFSVWLKQNFIFINFII